jgi:hypothetical protein
VGVLFCVEFLCVSLYPCSSSNHLTDDRYVKDYFSSKLVEALLLPVFRRCQVWILLQIPTILTLDWGFSKFSSGCPSRCYDSISNQTTTTLSFHLFIHWPFCHLLLNKPYISKHRYKTKDLFLRGHCIFMSFKIQDTSIKWVFLWPKALS